MITEICGIDARGQYVAGEHFAIAAERGYALLDARAAGIEQADDWRAILDRHILDLGHLVGMRFGERAAEHGEVLGEYVDDAAVDGAPPRDHAVARDFRLLHAEIDAAMLDEHIEFFEGTVVEQKVDALPRRELAPFMLRLAALLAAARARPLAPDFQLFQDFFHVAAHPSS